MKIFRPVSGSDFCFPGSGLFQSAAYNHGSQETLKDIKEIGGECKRYSSTIREDSKEALDEISPEKEKKDFVNKQLLQMQFSSGLGTQLSSKGIFQQINKFSNQNINHTFPF